MSTHKNIDKICIAVIILALMITIIFMNGEKLGLKKIVDDNTEGYTGTEYFTANDQDGTWDDSQATSITLEETDATIDGNGAYVNDGNVVISNGGRYVITGTLTDGKIIINADNSSKIWVRLNGININCSDDACLRVDQADKVFLTLADGTENTFTSGATYSDEALEDNTGGVIFSHDDLTINGRGNLAITANYKHGIDVNDDLVITGGTIKITAPADAIHVNDNFRFMAANLTIDAEDDAIHADQNIYVESGTILVNTCYEGFESLTIDIAGGDITIYPTDDGMNANGNSENQIGNGMGGPPSGGSDPEATTGDGTTTETNDESKTATAGGSDPEANGSKTDTADKSNTESTGWPKPPTADESSTEAAGRPQADFKAESKTDTQEESKEETYIRITGGTITIINESGRDADGLDSNGDIFIDGGTIRISLPGDGPNNAIDYGSESGGECIITGGNIIACGGSSMIEELSSNSTQCAVLYIMEETKEAGTAFSVTDASGNEILNYIPKCSYSSVAFSCTELEQGATYNVITGENSEEITLESTSTTIGTASGFGNMGSFGTPPSGEPPSGVTPPSGGFPPGNNSSEGDSTSTVDSTSVGDNTSEKGGTSTGDSTSEKDGSATGDTTTEKGSTSGGDSSSEKTSSSESNGEENTFPDMPDMSQQSGDKPESVNNTEGTKGSSQTEETSVEENTMPDKQTWILLGESFLALAVGIVIAIRFRKN